MKRILMVAQYDSRCKVCGDDITEGEDKIWYKKGAPVWHERHGIDGTLNVPSDEEGDDIDTEDGNIDNGELTHAQARVLAAKLRAYGCTVSFPQSESAQIQREKEAEEVLGYEVRTPQRAAKMLGVTANAIRSYVLSPGSILKTHKVKINGKRKNHSFYKLAILRKIQKEGIL